LSSVVIITGGAGGMGLAAAKLLGHDYHVVLADVNEQKLSAAATELQADNIHCSWFACDITNANSVGHLMSNSGQHGEIAAVLHTAGLSPQMANPETIIRVNALGTVNIVNACLTIAHADFTLVNVASMAAYMFPGLLIPKKIYPLALSEPEKFLHKILFRCKLMPKDLLKKGLAYSISKHFVTWLTQQTAAEFGAKGARTVSVSPGSIDTAMGRLEEKSGSAEMLKTAALKRFGRPEEIAEVMAFCISNKASYLTGVDILVDGGVVAGRAK